MTKTVINVAAVGFVLITTVFIPFTKVDGTSA